MGARVWRSVSLVPACAVALGTLIVTAAQSVPGPRPANGDIVFVSDRRGVDNLYLARLDRSGIQELTHSALPVDAVRASPTGKRLALTVFKDSLQATEIWVTDLAGRRARRITPAREFVNDSGVDWSPDGKRLVFVRDDGNEGFSAYVVALDGSPPKPIPRSGRLTSPAWSPDGERIAFIERNDKGDCGVVTVRPDGSDRRSVPTTRRMCAYVAAWSSDGRMLTVGARNGLYTITLDGKPVRRLIGWRGTSFGDLQWSPNGKNLVLTTYDPGTRRQGIALVSSAGRLNWLVNGRFNVSPTWVDSTSLFFKRGRDLWTVRIGGSPKRITHYRPASEPAWSPDGSTIAFTALDRGRFDTNIYELKPDGGSPWLSLVQSSAREHSPAWAPDGRHLAFTRDGQFWDSIWTASRGGGGERHIADGVTPAWSPDGAQIAYTVLALNVVPASGGRSQRLTPTATQLRSDAEWQPNGGRIAYTRYGLTEDWDVRTNVYVVVPDRWRHILIHNASDPAWSPDGKEVAFVRDGDIWVRRLQNGYEHLIVGGPFRERSPDWGRR
jgi:Tol biopolymer transport system component